MIFFHSSGKVVYFPCFLECQSPPGLICTLCLASSSHPHHSFKHRGRKGFFFSGLHPLCLSEKDLKTTEESKGHSRSRSENWKRKSRGLDAFGGWTKNSCLIAFIFSGSDDPDMTLSRRLQDGAGGRREGQESFETMEMFVMPISPLKFRMKAANDRMKLSFSSGFLFSRETMGADTTIFICLVLFMKTFWRQLWRRSKIWKSVDISAVSARWWHVCLLFQRNIFLILCGHGIFIPFSTLDNENTTDPKAAGTFYCFKNIGKAKLSVLNSVTLSFLVGELK